MSNLHQNRFFANKLCQYVKDHLHLIYYIALDKHNLFAPIPRIATQVMRGFFVFHLSKRNFYI